MIIEGIYPVSARKIVDGWSSPGIAFEDYARMSTQQRKASGERRLPTPDWSVNDKMLRLLLVTFMEERAGFRKKQKGELPLRLARANAAIIAQRPRYINILDGLCKEYVRIKQLGLNPETTAGEWNASRQQPFLTVSDPENGALFEEEAKHEAEKKRRRELEIEIEGLDTYLRLFTVTGGADIVAAVVYLYYRAGMDSVGVGAELGMKPPHVRQTLWRLHETWKKMSQPAGKSASKDDTSAGTGANKNTNLPAGEGLQVPALAEPLFDTL